MSEDDFPQAEWTVDEWTEEWSIKVGGAYACPKCSSMVMVVKGGVGVLEPKCCSTDMAPVEKPE